MKNELCARISGSIIPKTVVFQGRTYKLLLHMKTATYGTLIVDSVTEETTGRKVVGAWQWGSYGRNHIQQLEFDMRKGPNYLGFRSIAAWCNGRKKNGQRYLVAIMYENEIK